MNKYDNRLVECQVFHGEGSHELRAWQPVQGETHLLIVKCLDCSWLAVFFGSDHYRTILQSGGGHSFSVGANIQMRVDARADDGFDDAEWSRMLNG